MKKFAHFLMMAVLLLMPVEAEAVVWRVYYNDSGRPGGSKTDVIRAISQALREFESSVYNNNVVVRYEGETSQSHFQDGRRIVVTWRPLTNQCGRTCFQDFFHCHPGLGPREIQISTLFQHNPLWAPSGAVTACADLQSTLLHEFAHQFRNIGVDDDPPNNVWRNTGSVLSVSVPDVAIRHLWNEDSMPVGGRAYPTEYGPHLSEIRLQIQDSSNQQILSTVDLGARPHTPVAIAMGDGAFAQTGSGPRQRNFALAWGGRPGGTPTYSTILYVTQHSGSEAFWTQTIPGSATMRRPCIATQGLHQVVVFAGQSQSPDVQNISSPAALNAGLRTIFQSESHDGGFTWSAPEALFGQTRNGVSCDVDPSNGRVVLVVQGADETVWSASRPASALGASSWSGFTQFVRQFSIIGNRVPQTREIPEIVFDRFQPNAGGLLAWMQDTTLRQTVATVRFDGFRYECDPIAYERVEISGVPTHELLRTHPVMSFDSQPVFHFMTSLGTQMTAFSQRDFALSGSQFTSVSWTITPAPVSWYTGAAQNPSSFTTGTVQRMILNPS